MLKDHRESQMDHLPVPQVSMKHPVDKLHFYLYGLVDVFDGTSEHNQWTWSSFPTATLIFDEGVSRRSISESALAMRGRSILDGSFMIDNALLSAKQLLIETLGQPDEIIGSAIREFYETEMSALVRLRSSKLRDIYQLDVVNE